MARRRFFVDEISRGSAEVTGDQAHHMRNVLRVEAGQTYEISDSGRAYLAEVGLSTKQRVVFNVVEEIPAVEPPVRVDIYLALIKFERFELAVEKATELGVQRIVPVIARRSERGLEKGARKRVVRWRKIAREASQQSRRLRLPEVADPVSFQAAVVNGASSGWFLDENSGVAPLLGQAQTAARNAAAKPVALLVGPEGGWTDSEREIATEAGWRLASLGTQILRAETAALAAVALVMSAWTSPAEGKPPISGGLRAY